MTELPEKISGKRIYLKKHEKTIAHAHEMYDLAKASLCEIQPWLDWATPEYALESTFEYMIQVQELWQKEESYVYAIYLANGKAIGDIGLLNIDKRHNHAEVGYWMATEFTGNGYMQEAVGLLEQAAFAAGMHKIIIRTDVLNHKSASVAQKSGYTLDGIMREEIYSKNRQRYCDVNVFSKVNPTDK